MRVVVCDSPDEAADLVAGEILAALERKPELVLGLATGSTPVGVYERLGRAHRDRGVDFSRVRTFNLDEYLGLAADHAQSYRFFMREHLFDGIGLPERNIHFPPTEGPDLRDQCRRYEDEIRAAGGIDIQLLGIGSNGHIGFNEPCSSLASRTRVVTLTDKTLHDNARFYEEGEFQPEMACTMGIGTILDAKRILLQSFGTKKAPAIRSVVEGAVSSFWPGTALQLHADTNLYLDAPSASLLTMVDFFRRSRADEQRLIDKGWL
jgi:glucosamine-6-phosphate deaminase